MDDAVAVAVAALVGLAAVGAGVAVVDAGTAGWEPADDRTAQPPTPDNGSTARMEIGAGSIARAGGAQPEPDFAAALSDGAEEFQQDHTTRLVRQRFLLSSDREVRQNVLGRALIDLEERAGDLQRRHWAAVRAYAEGDIDESTLLRRLAAIHEAASRLLSTRNQIQTLKGRLGADYLDPRLDKMTLQLQSVTGPARAAVSEALAANGSLSRVHVAVNEPGTKLVVATVVDGRYVRTASFAANRQPSGEVRIGSSGDALTWFNDNYPWASSNSNNIRLSNYADSGYRIDIQHERGRLTAYLDKRSADVFQEEQSLQLATLPTEPRDSATNDGVEVVLNATYPGGPVRVEVYDADTGNRIEGVVTVDGTDYGVTGPDGALWFVEPRSSYTVSVDSGTATVAMNVSAPG